jgi:hypothetical protein
MTRKEKPKTSITDVRLMIAENNFEQCMELAEKFSDLGRTKDAKNIRAAGMVWLDEYNLLKG